MDLVDQRVREVLKVKFLLGLFDNPFPGNGAEADAKAGIEHHEDFALDICKRSLVLLKNADNLLPLDKNNLKKILVTGPLADEESYMTSRYGPNGIPGTTVLKGIQDHVGSSVQVVYEKGCNAADPKWPESEIIPYPMTDDEKSMMQKAVDAASDVLQSHVSSSFNRRASAATSASTASSPGIQ